MTNLEVGDLLELKEESSYLQCEEAKFFYIIEFMGNIFHSKPEEKYFTAKAIPSGLIHSFKDERIMFHCKKVYKRKHYENRS